MIKFKYRLGTIILSGIAFWFTGCASLKSVSITQIPADRKNHVAVSESNYGFLGIHFTNGFVDDLADRLREKCPNGKISGIYTKYETHFYFIIDRRKVTAHGYCDRPVSRGDES